jgi:hypothetical protein
MATGNAELPSLPQSAHLVDRPRAAHVPSAAFIRKPVLRAAAPASPALPNSPVASTFASRYPDVNQMRAALSGGII